MAICVSHGGQPVSQTARPSDVVLVATTDGVVSLQRAAPGASWSDAGATWEHLTDRSARIVYPDALVMAIRMACDQ